MTAMFINRTRSKVKTINHVARKISRYHGHVCIEGDFGWQISDGRK